MLDEKVQAVLTSIETILISITMRLENIERCLEALDKNTGVIMNQNEFVGTKVQKWTKSLKGK